MAAPALSRCFASSQSPFSSEAAAVCPVKQAQNVCVTRPEAKAVHGETFTAPYPRVDLKLNSDTAVESSGYSDHGVSRHRISAAICPRSD